MTWAKGQAKWYLATVRCLAAQASNDAAARPPGSVNGLWVLRRLAFLLEMEAERLASGRPEVR